MFQNMFLCCHQLEGESRITETFKIWFNFLCALIPFCSRAGVFQTLPKIFLRIFKWEVLPHVGSSEWFIDSHTVSQCLGFCDWEAVVPPTAAQWRPPRVAGSECSGTRAQWSMSAEATYSESAQCLTETWEVSALDLSKLFWGNE